MTVHADTSTPRQPERNPPRRATGRLGRKVVARSLIHVCLLALGFVFSIPLLWVITTSFKGQGGIFTYPIKWIPDPIVWSNYPRLLNVLTFSDWPGIVFFFRNTFFISILATVGTLVSSILVAYSFARLQWPERNFLFSLSLATMMLPSVVILIPTFLLFRDLKWLNTFMPMIVPFWFAVQGFYIFLLRQFFLGLPAELEEAARIDGANSLRILWGIVVPLSRPAIVTVSIFSFLQHYNEFLSPLLYLNAVEKFPMALGMRMFQGTYTNDWPLMMAATATFILPTICLFLMAQRHFIQGIQLTGLAGR